MRSFFDDKPQEVIYYDKSREWTLLMLGISFLILLVLLFYLSRKVNYVKKTEEFQNSSSHLNSSNSPPSIIDNKYLFCPHSYCAVSILSGAKRCASDKDAILYDIATEVCVEKNKCPQQKMPYAVNSDGSVNLNGVCENNTTCNCASAITCSNKTSVLFQTDGSPYDFSKMFTISQQPVPIDKGISITPPKINDFSQFCEINMGYIDRISAYCSLDESIEMAPNYSLRYKKTNDTMLVDKPPTYINLDTDEMQSVNKIDREFAPTHKNIMKCINYNPCIEGFLSINTTNPKTFGQLVKDEDGNINLSTYYKDPSLSTFSCRFSNPCTKGFNTDKKLFYPSYDKCLIENIFETDFTNNECGVEEYEVFFTRQEYNGELQKKGFANKTGLSWYYPVWDETINNNRCIRLYPLIIATAVCKVANNNFIIEYIRVEVSGKDFGHYMQVGGSYFWKGINTPENELLFGLMVDGNITKHELIAGQPVNKQFYTQETLCATTNSLRYTHSFGIDCFGRVTHIYPKAYISNDQFSFIPEIILKQFKPP